MMEDAGRPDGDHQEEQEEPSPEKLERAADRLAKYQRMVAGVRPPQLVFAEQVAAGAPDEMVEVALASDMASITVTGYLEKMQAQLEEAARILREHAEELRRGDTGS